MLIYLLVPAIIAVIARVAEQNDRPSPDFPRVPRNFGILGFIMVVFLAGISAFRWGVGTDYWNYYNSFSRYVAEAEEGIPLWEEPGIRAIAWLVNWFGGDAIVMLGVAAIFTIFLTIRSIWRWSPALTFACLIYIVSGSWYGSFNAVRQYLAAAILLAGHRHIIERQFFRWLLIVAVASLFHVSALVGILLYFVPRKLISFPGQIIVILLAMLGMYAGNEILELIDSIHRQGAISDSDNALNEVSFLRVAFSFLPLLLHWLTPTPKSVRDLNGGFYINMLLVYAAGMLAMSSSVFLARFIIYPQLFIGIGLAYVTHYENRYERLAVRTILILLFAIFMYFEVSGNPSLNDFSWVFDREESR